jgi:hypothetical protein
VGQPFASRLGGQRFTFQGCTNSQWDQISPVSDVSLQAAGYHHVKIERSLEEKRFKILAHFWTCTQDLPPCAGTQIVVCVSLQQAICS